MNTMPELLIEETRHFDKNHFYCEYEGLTWRDQTPRHIGEHITKAGFKLVEYEEGTGSADIIRQQVIPDLALYRTQIINLLGFDPDEIDWDAHSGDEENVAQSILWAAGMINRYVEPTEHSAQARHENLATSDLVLVPVRLHFAAAALARAHGVDLVEAQRARMAR